MSSLLAKHADGRPNFDCKTLVAPLGSRLDVVTRVSLKRAVEQLFKDQADVALLHFSGHGTANNLDGYLVTQDAKQYDEGLSMSDLLQLANASKADEVVIFLDCCQSGSLGNLPAIDNRKAHLREGLSILTASRGDQVSVEVAGGGLFTSLVSDALQGGAADILGDVTAPAIYAFVEAALGAWDQRPLFKSHVAKVIALRECEPAVDRSVLRKIPDLFPLPAEDLPLDPGYEPTSSAPEPSKVLVFGLLQQLNRVHLVVPLNAPHMYEAAMNSKGCRLTASGRYYWRLAKSGRL
jgi:uncharacterized caspase-like protein